MLRCNYYLPERQSENLKELAVKVDISASELLRKMIEHCLQPKVMNELVPSMSGHLSLMK